MKSSKFFQFHCSSNVLLLEALDHYLFLFFLVCCTRVLLRLHQHESILEITALIRGIGTQYHQCWGIYIVLHTFSSILFVLLYFGKFQYYLEFFWPQITWNWNLSKKTHLISKKVLTYIQHNVPKIVYKV